MHLRATCFLYAYLWTVKSEWKSNLNVCQFSGQGFVFGLILIVVDLGVVLRDLCAYWPLLWSKIIRKTIMLFVCIIYWAGWDIYEVFPSFPFPPLPYMYSFFEYLLLKRILDTRHCVRCFNWVIFTNTLSTCVDHIFNTEWKKFTVFCSLDGFELRI